MTGRQSLRGSSGRVGGARRDIRLAAGRGIVVVLASQLAALGRQLDTAQRFKALYD